MLFRSGLNGIGGEFTKRLTQENGLLQGLVEKTLPQKGILKKTLPGGFKLPF